MSTLATFALFVASTHAILPGIGDSGGDKIATRNVFVTMTHGTLPILDAIGGRNFLSRGEKLTALKKGLQGHAALTQGPLITFLKGPLALSLSALPFTMETLWISNQLYLKGVNSGVLGALSATFPSQIASIKDETFAEISPIFVGAPFESRQKQNEPVWGVPRVKAPDAWRRRVRGQRVRVGVIDSGVRWTHEALKDNYVGKDEYGWFDPSGKTEEPNDPNGHGTHCTGIVCGTKNNIGVAPGAKWMACKGCVGNRCSSSDVAKCAQFMMCPTDPKGNAEDCSKAPHVVSNSWGVGRNDGFEATAKAYKAAGIVAVFAIGNWGRWGCRNAASPGDSPDIIGVGSTTINNTLSVFSSKGPGRNNVTKPDVSAPGSDVYSSSNKTDRSYAVSSGTSMACPHVAGVVALMLSSVNKAVTPDEVRAALVKGCDNRGILAERRISERCDENKGAYRYPNNDYGHGLVNAVKAIRHMRST